MTNAPFVMPLRVRYVECDMQGRVFNGHYLTWLDMAHTEALREIAGGDGAMVDAGIDVVVAAAELSFRRPATYDDELVVTTRLGETGNTSLRSEFTIARGDELIAECVMTHVCVDAETFVKTPWPDWLRKELAG
jgi:acyl-CoA thioester hydrolase